MGHFGHFQGEVAADCGEPLPWQQSPVLRRGHPRLRQHNNEDRQFWIFASRWFASRMQFASYCEARCGADLTSSANHGPSGLDGGAP
jgi:hypothetical protein